MNNQQIKRRNPFARPIAAQEEEVKQVEEVVKVEPVKVEEPVQEIQETAPVEEEIVKIQPKQTPKTVKPAAKQKIVDDKLNSKEKFTSTMDVTLRRKIKIVCATRGIMFSEYIEQACREKLKKDGE